MTIRPKGHDERGPFLVMSAEEVLERNALNIANTTEALQKRRAAVLAQLNGQSANLGSPLKGGSPYLGLAPVDGEEQLYAYDRIGVDALET